MKIRNIIRRKKIGVLYGGWSSEREISIKSGKTIIKALKGAGCNVVGIDVGRNVISKIKNSKIEIAFIALHGPFGEDGTIQAILELLNIPYTGSNVLSSALAMNKVYSKKVFQWHKLPTPKWQVIQKPISNPPDSLRNPGHLQHFLRQHLQHLRLPAVVKPALQGSTIGVSIIQNKNELKKALSKAFRYGDTAILERYISGREMTVGVLGDISLPVIEIIPTGSKFYDYRAKYAPGGSKHIVPAKIPRETSKYLQSLARKAFDALGCRAVARVDFRLDRNGNPYLLEVNTIPGMTETSLLPESAKVVNIDFGELALRIIEYSCYRNIL